MALYAFIRREDGDLVKAESELVFSIAKTYDLYHHLLLLVLEISDVATDRIERALQKKMPTPQDLNPNRRFIDNPVIVQLRNNRSLNKYLNGTKLSWVNFAHIPRILFNNMLSWDEFGEYMNQEEMNYQWHKKFVINLVSRLFSASEDLVNSLEEQSIYWNDDLEYVLLMIEKTLKKFRAASGEQAELMPLYKNREDEEFVKLLFRKAVLNYRQSSELIDNNTTNWEVDRIALMDTLVMQLAIAEVLEFPEIPVKVTLNEYIEIAKYYCTPKSSTFVNGILDNIFREMREKGLLKKYGRGLIGESTDSKLNN